MASYNKTDTIHSEPSSGADWVHREMRMQAWVHGSNGLRHIYTFLSRTLKQLLVLLGY